METDTSILCDEHPADVNVVEPLFTNFGGIASFSGQVVTIKCFEDNGLLYKVLEKDGCGKVLVVDGGGSLRRALVDADIIELAVRYEWEGLIIYGSVRHVDYLAEAEIGIQAIAAIPAKADHKGEGEINIGVSFGGVTFYTGDYVYADNTGILSSEVYLQIDE